MVVSCCDSRVDPETIFSAMPGELFVVRNVANLVPPFETQGKYHGVSAALEFAALNLRVKHIVVMGHSGCGGVRACLDSEALRQTEAAFVTNWMSMLDGARQQVLAANPGGSPAQLRRALERDEFAPLPARFPASRRWRRGASPCTGPTSTSPRDRCLSRSGDGAAGGAVKQVSAAV
jgi:hypothetical protein